MNLDVQVTINMRLRNSVKVAKPFPGANCGSDHVLVVLDIRVQLKRQKKYQYKLKIDVIALGQDNNFKDLYIVSVGNKYYALRKNTEEDSIENDCLVLRDAIEESAI